MEAFLKKLIIAFCVCFLVVNASFLAWCITPKKVHYAGKLS